MACVFGSVFRTSISLQVNRFVFARTTSLGGIPKKNKGHAQQSSSIQPKRLKSDFVVGGQWHSEQVAVGSKSSCRRQRTTTTLTLYRNEKRNDCIGTSPPCHNDGEPGGRESPKVNHELSEKRYKRARRSLVDRVQPRSFGVEGNACELFWCWVNTKVVSYSGVCFQS